MDKLKAIYTKAEKKHFGAIVLVQSVLILILVVVLVQKSTTNFMTKGAESSFSDEITKDAKACMMLSFEERPVCAKAAGVKIANHTQDAKQRLAECLKFRPYYVSDCQLGLEQP